MSDCHNLPRTNTKLLAAAGRNPKSLPHDSRQQRRRRAIEGAMELLRERFGWFNRALQYPYGMTRAVRRSMMRYRLYFGEFPVRAA